MIITISIYLFLVAFELPTSIKDSFPDFKPIDPIIPRESPFHLSLTRTLYVKDYQKDLFRTKIDNIIKKSLKSHPLPASINCEKVSIYLNDENTRTFLAVDVENNAAILKLIEEIDSILKEFNLPGYYSSPKLHFSVLWRQGNHSKVLDTTIKDLDLDHFEESFVNLSEIIIKCGNKVSKIEV